MGWIAAPAIIKPDEMSKSKKNIKNYFPLKPYNLESFLENENFAFKTSRRGFFKYVGLSAATLALTEACRTKTANSFIRNIPSGQYPSSTVKKYFATTCSGCAANCPVLVKTINGIPVKTEGNPASKFSGGGLCILGQSIMEDLFKEKKYQSPQLNGLNVSWPEADKQIIRELEKIKSKNGKIVILSPTINSPSSLKLIKEFSEKYGQLSHIAFDTFSSDAILKSNERCFGKRVIPNYLFDKAKTILSFGADFLGNWISPVEFSRKYAVLRDIDNKRELSYHVQVESILSLTGANAGKRIAIKPSEEGIFLLNLYNAIAGLAAVNPLKSTKSCRYTSEIKELAHNLWSNRGRSLVIGNSNLLQNQMLINGINSLLGNFGRTIDLENTSLQKTGNDEEFISLADEIISGNIDALLLAGFPQPLVFPQDFHTDLIKKIHEIPLLISFADFDLFPGNDHSLNTPAQKQFICPAGHFLEEWNDHQPYLNFFSLSQPVLQQLAGTRPFQDSLLAWSGNKTPYPDYIRENWKENILTGLAVESDFENLWIKTLSTGVFEKPALPLKKYNFDLYLEPEARQALKYAESSDNPEFLFIETHFLKNEFSNSILQELPDPVDKSCWNDYALISAETAIKYKLGNGDMIELDCPGNPVFPVLICEGQAEDTVAIPGIAGFKTENENNPFIISPLYSVQNKLFSYSGQLYKFKKTGKSISVAKSQIDLKNNPELPFPEYTLAEFFEMPFPEQNADIQFFSHKKKFITHHWSMVIDLNLCTGCGSCAASCMVENNIPSVGKKQNLKRREMQWLRIDRYYSKDKNNRLKVSFLPLMCQHCNNAPCEAVCPVSATSSGSEGINQQVYQRCIGSRYCAANCPYQVRKFNFNDYFRDEPYDAINNNRRKYLNPDVSIRGKGVIEKCSMCVQRIQDAKNTAKSSNIALQDGEIKTACSQSCPVQAISFGDLNDKGSRVYSLLNSKRAFSLLGKLGTEPSVIYLAKVRNSEIDISSLKSREPV